MKKIFLLVMISAALLSATTVVNAQQTKDTTTQATQKQVPYVKINGLLNGYITKEDLLKVDSLVCTDRGLIITSFTLTIVNAGTLTTYPGKSNKITTAMKTAIAKMATGNKLYFEDMVAKLADGTVYKLAAISIAIK